MFEPTFTITREEERRDFGRYAIEPLEAGYGHTVGNALRRVLLTSLLGAAVTQVKISGVRHQFTTIAGLKEDVVELILNIKQLRVKYKGEKPVKLTLSATGPGQVKAAKIKTPAGVEIVNRDLVLGALADKKSKLSVELTVETGLGYSLAEERKTGTIGLIPVDATFTPVTHVNYRVEATRVGRRANLDKLIMEITTDGTISPKDAMVAAAQILVDHFQQVVKPKKARPVKVEKEKIAPAVAKLTVEELGLPTRIANSLRGAGLGTVADITQTAKSDLVKVKNLGEKSVKIIEAALVDKGVKLKE